MMACWEPEDFVRRQRKRLGIVAVTHDTAIITSVSPDATDRYNQAVRERERVSD